MRNHLVILAAGLVLAVAYGASATALAGVNPPGHLSATPAASHVTSLNTAGTCAYITDEGNGESGYIGAGNSLYFDSAETSFCNHSIPINGRFEIVAALPGGGTGCLKVDSATGTINVESQAGCDGNGGNGNTWDQWTATGAVIGIFQAWQLKNVYNGKCLYDDRQNPAIYAICDTSTSHPDLFEWFVWGSGL